MNITIQGMQTTIYFLQHMCIRNGPDLWNDINNTTFMYYSLAQIFQNIIFFTEGY